MLKLNDVPRPFALLPPGLIQATLAEFIAVFANNPGRRLLIENYLKFRSELDPLLPGATHLIDGSFVEDKKAPADIDTVVLFDYDKFKSCSRSQRHSIWALIGEGGVAYKKYRIDAYGFPLVKPCDPEYHITWKNFAFWLPLLGNTRDGLPKGIIRLCDNANDDALNNFLRCSGLEVLK